MLIMNMQKVISVSQSFILIRLPEDFYAIVSIFGVIKYLDIVLCGAKQACAMIL